MADRGLRVASKGIQKAKASRGRRAGLLPGSDFPKGVSRGCPISQVEGAARAEESIDLAIYRRQSRDQEYGHRAGDWTRDWKLDNVAFGESKEGYCG